MNVCPTCEERNIGGAYECFNCGEALRSAPAAEAEPPKIPGGVETMPSRAIWLIAGGVLVLTVTMALVWELGFRDSSNKQDGCSPTSEEVIRNVTF